MTDSCSDKRGCYVRAITVKCSVEKRILVVGLKGLGTEMN
jgi:hypothetical protein